ncbi:hypothetical protein SO802_021344 [Lithocarpus litseifolius]|uniref:Uncharacterized protein n=1 Tax=Lithocarpus litseifolius TaxID=425828 RepID=A0AAW2CG29_9ROSI
MGEGSKPTKPNRKEEKEKEDRHRSALLDALNGKEMPIKTTPQEVLTLIGVEALFHPSFTFSNKKLPLEGATHTRPLQITKCAWRAKVPMVLIDNGSAMNVCPFRSALTIGLDIKTIIPSLLTVRAYDTISGKVMRTFKAPCKEEHGFIPLGLSFPLYTKKMKISWKGGIDVVLGDGEILAPICGLEEGGSELQMIGFEFMNMADYGLKDERYTTNLLSYCSHEVIAMMKNMGYMPVETMLKEEEDVLAITIKESSDPSAFIVPVM